MKNLIGSKLQIQTLCVTFLLLALITSLGCDIYRDMHKEVPKDSELERIFRENRESFVTLVRMAEEDSAVTRIAYDFTWVSGSGSSSDTGETGISDERWDEYKALFRKTRLEKGINREENGTVTFLAFTRGLAVSGLTKGYLFTKNNRDCSATSLDDLDEHRDSHFICKKIDENWYLYLRK